MTTVKDIRHKLAQSKPSLGSWLQINSPDVAEILSQAGYDWIAVDMEHGAISHTDLPSLFRAIECGGAAPFVRLSEAHKVTIKAALDAGAHGLIFPRIESFEHLDSAIQHALYPNLGGERGFGYCRANVFGKEFDEYRNNLAQNIFFVAQIEHINAVRELENIIAHPHLDAIMVGPYDLSGSMNIVGQFEHSEFISAMQHIIKTCKENNTILGIHIAKPDQQALSKFIDEGYTFIAYGIDSVFLWQGSTKPEI